MTAALGKVCNACNIERKKKRVLYHPETLLPYCEHPYICNDEHPNSPKNLIMRGEEIKLIDFEEAQEKFGQWLALNHPDKEVAEAIRRMVTMPTTIRIGSPELAQFILKLQKELGFGSVSEAIRYCIQQLKEAEHAYYHKHEKLAEQKATQEAVKTAIASVEVEPEPTEPEPTEEEKPLAFDF